MIRSADPAVVAALISACRRGACGPGAWGLRGMYRHRIVAALVGMVLAKCYPVGRSRQRARAMAAAPARGRPALRRATRA